MSERKSLIKQSTGILKALTLRFEELNLSYGQAAAEARRFGVSGINPQTLSRYFSGQQKNTPTEEGIIFLCYRYCIPVTLTIGIRKIDDGKIIRRIPVYNEQTGINLVKKILGYDEQQTVPETAKLP